MKKQPVLNEIQMELPDRDKSNVELNTSIDNSVLGQRRRQMQNERQVQREFYDQPYNPPSKIRPNLEGIMKKQPVLNVMQMQLPVRDMSNAQVNTSIDNSAVGQRRRQLQNERQAQREADRKFLLTASKP